MTTLGFTIGETDHDYANYKVPGTADDGPEGGAFDKMECENAMGGITVESAVRKPKKENLGATEEMDVDSVEGKRKRENLGDKNRKKKKVRMS